MLRGILTKHDCHMNPWSLRNCCSESFKCSGMCIVVAVRKIESCNIHASINQISKALFGPTCRT